VESTIEERLARLADGGVATAERRALLDEVIRLDPGAIVDARAQGRFDAAWPEAAQARTLAGDDVVLLAVCMPTHAIAEALTASPNADMDRLVLGVRLASVVARYDIAAAERLEPLLRARLSDKRPAFPWLAAPSDSVGAFAQPHHLAVLRIVAARNRDRASALFEATMRASLERGGPAPSLYGVFEAALRQGLRGAWLADILNGVLGDPRATPGARLAARHALDTLAGLATHPDGAPADLPIAVARAREVADGLLEGILREATTPADLRDAVRAQLHRWSPAVFLRLQREGVLPTEPVPSRRQHKDWTPAGTEALALRVSCDEAAALLDAPREEDLDRLVTALRIAHVYAAWLPGELERFAHAFIRLLPSRLAVPMKSGARPLGEVALERFPCLFPPRDSQTQESQQLLLAGLETARAAGLAFDSIADWLPNLLTRASLQKLGIR